MVAERLSSTSQCRIQCIKAHQERDLHDRTWSQFKTNSDKSEKEELKYKHTVLLATQGNPHKEIWCFSWGNPALNAVLV